MDAFPLHVIFRLQSLRPRIHQRIIKALEPLLQPVLLRLGISQLRCYAWQYRLLSRPGPRCIIVDIYVVCHISVIEFTHHPAQLVRNAPIPGLHLLQATHRTPLTTRVPRIPKPVLICVIRDLSPHLGILRHEHLILHALPAGRPLPIFVLSGDESLA